jgi:chemotaxis protein histidine kinase CheA
MSEFRGGTLNSEDKIIRLQQKETRRRKEASSPSKTQTYQTTPKLQSSEIDMSETRKAAVAAAASAAAAEAFNSSSAANAKTAADSSAGSETAAKEAVASSKKAEAEASASANSASAAQKDLVDAKKLVSESQQAVTNITTANAETSKQLETMSTIAQDTRTAAEQAVPVLQASTVLGATANNFAVTEAWSSVASIAIPTVDGMTVVLLSVSAVGAVIPAGAGGIRARLAVDGEAVCELPLPIAGDSTNWPGSIGDMRNVNLTAHVKTAPGKTISVDFMAASAADYPADASTQVHLMARVDYRRETA